MGSCQNFFEKKGAQELVCIPRGGRGIGVARPGNDVLRLGNWATLHMVLEEDKRVSRPRTPPKVGPTRAQNLEGCRRRANKSTEKGEGDKLRTEHFLRVEKLKNGAAGRKGTVGKERTSRTCSG
jgi:hypothetical protein